MAFITGPGIQPTGNIIGRGVQPTPQTPSLESLLELLRGRLTLADIADDPQSARYAVSAVDAANLPLLAGVHPVQGMPWPSSAGVTAFNGLVGNVTGVGSFNAQAGAVTVPDIITSGGANRVALEITGSGHQLGDQRSNLAVNSAGVVSRWVGLSISYTAAAGTPATATISVTAAHLAGVLPNANWISYNASSANVTGTGGTNATFYLYYNDPLMSGGTQTLAATTNGNNVYLLSAVYIGTVQVTFPSSGSGSGSGSGGLCVGDEMFIHEGLRAGDAVVGDVFDCIDLPSESGKHQRALQGLEHYIGPRIRVITDKGGAWIGGLDTPFDVPDGRQVLATRLMGEQVVTDWGIETVTSLALTGPGPLTRNHLGGVSYAAGADPRHRIYSHNTAISKP